MATGFLLYLYRFTQFHLYNRNSYEVVSHRMTNHCLKLHLFINYITNFSNFSDNFDELFREAREAISHEQTSLLLFSSFTGVLFGRRSKMNALNRND